MTLSPAQISLTVSLRGNYRPVSNFIVETGAGDPYANSYVSLEYARSYFVGRRLHSSAWTAATTENKLIALKQASFALDNEFIWKGTPLTETQALGWPRTGALDRYKVERGTASVPREVKDATCELAMYLLAEDRLVGASGVGLKRLRVDVIELEFDKSQAPETFPAFVARMLNGLSEPVRGRGMIKTVTLERT